jgi:1,4-alpha-glucan branching enzyme
MKNILTLLCFISFISFSQTPTIEPDFFTATDEITISYDVAGTSLESLADAWIWMWLPGKGVDAPSNVNPASSNSSASNPAKMKRSTDGEGRVIFSITLTPTTFFGVAQNEIESMGMLLKGNDWSNGQTEDYVVQISNGFTLILETPDTNFGFYESAQDITIAGKTSEAADIEILVDNVSISNFSNSTEFSAIHTIIDDGQVHEIVVNASTDTESLQKKYSYTLTPSSVSEPVPNDMLNGINYTSSTSATLVLEAPNKEHVFVLSDLNDWSINAEYLMKKDGERFWIELPNLEMGKEYQFQYLVDGEIRIADPYSEKISSPFDDGEIISENRYPNLLPYPNGETSEAVSFLQTNKVPFEWADFTKPEKENLIIYELLIRDFTEERTYKAVTEKLDYLQDLGINALELMPVQEFEGNLSWGYNPAFMLAIDKYYGTELDLKTLINESHKRGIAVILDVVLNHQFGRNPLVRLYNEGLYGKPTPDNPWFNVNAKHDFNVGYDMNHDSQYTKDYTKRVTKYWIEEYNIDGYRFDLSKGFTQKNTLGNVGLWGQYDAARVATWKRIADEIWSIDPTSYIILEHFADNSEEKELANYGMMLWGNLNHTYRSAIKGGSTSLDWLFHESRGWNDPHLVGYMESHDEERIMWDALKGLSSTEALRRAKLSAVFFLTVPGPKMIWQFGEMGYDEELNNDRLGIKPTHWEYLDDPERKKLVDLYKSLVSLRTKTSYINPSTFDWDTDPWIKSINIVHPDVHIYITGNFNVSNQTANHKFSKTGTWYNYFTGESIEVTDINADFSLNGGQFSIYTSGKIDNYINENPLTLSSEKISENLFVYPNPTAEYLYLSTSGGGIYQITDISGKQVMEGSFDTGHTINIGVLESGIYTIQIIIDGNRQSKKIIKR